MARRALLRFDAFSVSASFDGLQYVLSGSFRIEPGLNEDHPLCLYRAPLALPFVYVYGFVFEQFSAEFSSPGAYVPARKGENDRVVFL